MPVGHRAGEYLSCTTQRSATSRFITPSVTPAGDVALPQDRTPYLRRSPGQVVSVPVARAVVPPWQDVPMFLRPRHGLHNGADERQDQDPMRRYQTGSPHNESHSLLSNDIVMET